MQNYDAAEALEMKLQHYIDQFIDLNELHSEELETCQQKLTRSVDEKVADFEKMIQRCVDSLKETVSNQHSSLATKKDEFQREVSHIHGEFQKSEQKRMDDKMLDVLLIKELKEENQE